MRGDGKCDGGGMKVEVALVRTDGCELTTVELDPPATVADAVAASGWGEQEFAAIAVFGEVVAPSRALQAGERVDLLPPLPVAPMAARRERARQEH